MKAIAVVFCLVFMTTFHQAIGQDLYPTFWYDKATDTLIFNRAWELYKQDKFSESLKVMEKLKNGYKTDASLLRLKSDCFAGLKDIEAAMECMNQAIMHAPECYGLLRDRSEIWIGKENFHAAAADLAAYLVFDPTNYTANYNYAYLLDKIGKRTDAISSLERYTGDESDLQELLADFYKEDENYDSAISILHDVIELDPKYESAYCNLAIVYQESGHTEKALYVIDRLIAINPDQGYAYYIKGWIYEQTGLEYDAEKNYELAEENGYEVYEEEIQ